MLGTLPSSVSFLRERLALWGVLCDPLESPMLRWETRQDRHMSSVQSLPLEMYPVPSHVKNF